MEQLRRAMNRPVESSPKAGDTGQKSFYSSYDAQTRQRPSAVTSFLDSQNSGAYFPAKIMSLQDLKRTRPPQLLSTDEDGVRNTKGQYEAFRFILQ